MGDKFPGAAVWGCCVREPRGSGERKSGRNPHRQPGMVRRALLTRLKPLDCDLFLVTGRVAVDTDRCAEVQALALPPHTPALPPGWEDALC